MMILPTSPRTPRRRAPRSADERPRAGYARRLGDLVPVVGDVAFRRFGFVQSSVISRWPEIAGERYASVSTPESIRFPTGRRDGGTLHLLVEGAHATMMQHVAPSIVERVNRFFGYEAIARIAIRQGAAAPRPARPKRVAARELPALLGDSLKAVGDPELRAVLEALARGLVEAPSIAIPVLGKVR